MDGLSRCDERLYTLNDFWEFDLAANRRQLLNLKSGI
jgi:hypothetical protein